MTFLSAMMISPFGEIDGRQAIDRIRSSAAYCAART